MLVVLTAVPTFEEAESLADKIVQAKLAACVQILPQMKSVYFWEGKMQRENEHLLLIKTLQEEYDNLEEFILANHSYSVPEIAAIDASKVSESYAKWLGDYLL